MKELRCAVIGLGIGKRHAMVLSQMDDLKLVAVADLKEELVGGLAKQLGVASYERGEELLGAEEIDFVCICTPPAAHLFLTEKAATQGINVFCEKPMAPSVKACEGMIEACREGGVKLMIGHKKRFQPAFRFLKEMSGEGADFGLPLWANLRYACGPVGMDWFWEEDNGGGPLLENSSHAFDMLRYLMGEVISVQAAGGNLFNRDRAPQLDTAAVSLRFETGAIASVGCGQAYEWSFAGENSFVACEKAVVEISGSFDNPEHLRYVMREEPERVIEVDQPERDLFEIELEHFAECIREDSRPLTSGEESMRAVEICLAVKRAVRSEEPVRLGE